MRARAVFVAVVTAVVASTLLLPWAAHAQTAAGIVETGWWTQNPAPNAPPGGFEVAQGPQGPLSVTAIRIQVDATTLTQGVLTLSEAQVVGTPALQLCPTTSQWKAANGGAYASAPAPNCATSVPLQRNVAAATETADVRKLVGAGPTTVSLMVVPMPDPSLPVQVPFDVTFGSAALLADGELPAPAPAIDNGDSSSSLGSTSTGDVSSSPSFGVPDLGFASTGAAPLALTPPPADQQVNAAPSQVEGRFPASGDIGLPKGRGPHKPWGRAPVFALIALAIGAAVAFGRERMRAMGWFEAS